MSTDHTIYLEAHGTGTRVCDPAELEAISKALGTDSREKELLVGSVKTNIGHSEAAAGIAGLIKCILVLENSKIPPTIGIWNLNPRVPSKRWNLQVADRLTSWPSNDKIWRISISSFGASGTIAHVVLDGSEAYWDAHN
ncbi:asperfuranone polyketide synthase afoG [Colletotrichum spaethianum]|uniref:Asperfuranone polyketide synthase afoG n=1 Tax=Colletotrichum spaethianum TaxID=700344 RepID=A0AA37LDN0_9PEZI|nr:asperfuranone polyketide synthase afoG [Colletotrichum spaethianum]GKT44478.1 asperfuranone polyketide synthase afoG [Colletotrichum spaethianum]